MAELKREGDDLVVVLSTAEKLEAAHGDVRVPVSSVSGVEVVDDVVHAVPGLKVIGAGWPGRFAIGTYSSGGERTFAVVHHDNNGGVKVRLEGERFNQLVISCADPESVASDLRIS
jgi:Bacterial PH domain